MTRIEQIRQREQQATKGPWTVGRIDHGDDEAPVNRPDGKPVAQVSTWTAKGAIDAEFVAHAREDIPHLLTLWDTRDAALRTLVEELRLPEGSLNVDHELNRVADALDAILKETTHD